MANYKMSGPSLYKSLWSGRNKAGGALKKPAAPKFLKGLGIKDILTGGLTKLGGGGGKGFLGL